MVNKVKSYVERLPRSTSFRLPASRLAMTLLVYNDEQTDIEDIKCNN